MRLDSANQVAGKFRVTGVRLVSGGRVKVTGIVTRLTWLGLKRRLENAVMEASSNILCPVLFSTWTDLTEPLLGSICKTKTPLPVKRWA